MTELRAELSPQEREALEDLHFSYDVFGALQAALCSGSLPDNAVTGRVDVPADGAIVELPGGAAGESLEQQGRKLLSTGSAALVLLNGGMATRFGSRVKGVVDALPGHSFLALQLQRLGTLAAGGQACPLLVMNSKTTAPITRAHLEGNEWFKSHQKLTEPLEGDDTYYERYAAQTYAPDVMTESALGFIKENAEEPFFMYFASIIPHVSLQVPREDVEAYPAEWDEAHYLGQKGYLPHPSPRRAYAGMVPLPCACRTWLGMWGLPTRQCSITSAPGRAWWRRWSMEPFAVCRRTSSRPSRVRLPLMRLRSWTRSPRC